MIGSDIDHKLIGIAKENALEAGLGDLIEWKQMLAEHLVIKKNNGYIITNPPYGVRIGDDKDIYRLYLVVGQIMSTYPRQSSYILTTVDDFEIAYGVKL